jgi:hypothetical protein
MRPVILGSAVFLMLILTIGGGGALAGRLTRPAALSQAAGPQVPSPASRPLRPNNTATRSQTAKIVAQAFSPTATPSGGAKGDGLR